MVFWAGRCTSLARLDGKTAIITGCNTGIGKHTVADLYLRGCRIVMACRNEERAAAAQAEILERYENEKGTGQLIVRKLDLSSLASVRDFSSLVLQEESIINILINNAGVMACPKSFTVDGFEMQFGTNHLGHFLLTLLLLPRIISSSPSRIINVSSLLHKTAGTLDWDNLNAEKSYSPLKNYSVSKLANILFTKELARRLHGYMVNVYAVHPGVVNTELSRHYDSSLFPGVTSFYQSFGKLFMKTSQEGAQTTIHCAVDEQAGTETGLYYRDCKPASSSSDANNHQLAERLWNVSLEMVKLTDFKIVSDSSSPSSFPIHRSV